MKRRRRPKLINAELEKNYFILLSEFFRLFYIKPCLKKIMSIIIWFLVFEEKALY
jgi:hypothetical protein